MCGSYDNGSIGGDSGYSKTFVGNGITQWCLFQQKSIRKRIIMSSHMRRISLHPLFRVGNSGHSCKGTFTDYKYQVCGVLITVFAPASVVNQYTSDHHECAGIHWQGWQLLTLVKQAVARVLMDCGCRI